MDFARFLKDFLKTLYTDCTLFNKHGHSQVIKLNQFDFLNSWMQALLHTSRGLQRFEFTCKSYFVFEIIKGVR